MSIYDNFTMQKGKDHLNKTILHLEGAAVLVLALYGYMYYEFSWWVFIILLFVPDLAMLGYLYNQKFGAIVYNLFHTYLLSLLVYLIGAIMNQEIVVLLGLIWTAHIGMDRMFGFGLKYPTKFQDTHLNRV